MEDNHQSTIGLFNKHVDGLLDGFGFRFHPVHAMAEENHIKFLIGITHARIDAGVCVAVGKEWSSMDLRRAMEIGKRRFQL